MKINSMDVLAILSVCILITTIISGYLNNKTTRFLKNLQYLTEEELSCLLLKFETIDYDRDETSIIYKIIDTKYYLSIQKKRFTYEYCIGLGSYDQCKYEMPYIALDLSIRKKIHQSYRMIKKGNKAYPSDIFKQALSKNLDKTYTRFAKNKKLINE